jgi:hypothetical protein
VATLLIRAIMAYFLSYYFQGRAAILRHPSKIQPARKKQKPDRETRLLRCICEYSFVCFSSAIHYKPTGSTACIALHFKDIRSVAVGCRVEVTRRKYHQTGADCIVMICDPVNRVGNLGGTRCYDIRPGRPGRNGVKYISPKP